MTGPRCEHVQCIRRPTLGCRKCEIRVCGYHAKIGAGAGATRSYCPRCGLYMYPLAGETSDFDKLPCRVLFFEKGDPERVRLISATNLMDPGAARGYASVLQGMLTGAFAEVELSVMNDGMIAASIAFKSIANDEVLRRHTDWAYGTAVAVNSAPSSSACQGLK